MFGAPAPASSPSSHTTSSPEFREAAGTAASDADAETLEQGEPQFYLTLVDQSNGVLPTKVHINRRRRTKIMIGRAEEADIVVRLAQPGERICVSRIHCEIEKNPCGDWALFDKGSRNGCFVNGVKVSSTVLKDGDVIILGGGGIIDCGSHVNKVDSIFQYRFNIVAPTIVATPVGKMTGVKRKLALNPAFAAAGGLAPSAAAAAAHQHQHQPCASSCCAEGLAKRMSGEKENRVAGAASGSPAAAAAAVVGGAGGALGVSEQLRDELSCGICLEVQVHPRVLACGHSFCCRCISTALGYHNRCPSCTAVVVQEPAKVVSLENAICSIYKHNAEYMTRRQEYDKLAQHERITSEKLVCVIAKARNCGKRFLVADTKWNKTECQIFAKGVTLYKGMARVEYCRTIGLTDAFVRGATPQQLAVVANNVGVNASSDCSIMDRLCMFIKYG
jgi:pSer/pThr/pTyr-binding forkhead associated (FHA) protein